MEQKQNNAPTEQGEYKVGPGHPPKERQFGKPNGNPRHNGSWKKEDTARYKLEKMMSLTERELMAIAIDEDAPYFERKLAKCINKGQWKEIEGMMNQVYGAPVAKTITKETDENDSAFIKGYLYP